MIQISFDEKQFHRLADETRNKIIALGTTSAAVLKRHEKITEMLVEHLKTLDIPFERDECLRWVDGFEHDPASALSSSYVEWIAYRRFIILLAEQEAGTLTSWKHYQSRKIEVPKSKNFQDALIQFQAYLQTTDLRPSSIERSERTARFLLLYLGNQGLSNVSGICNADIAGYFISPKLRACASEHIFLTSVGPAQKLARKEFRIKYRAEDTDIYKKIPQDGLQIFRRTFASRLLQCGTPLSMISEMLGQVSKNAVQRYLSTEEAKMKRCSLGLALIPYRKGDF